MNDARDMSPDFVLMRLVSAAEDDRRLDEENGTVPSGGGALLAHGGVKSKVERARGAPTTALLPTAAAVAANNKAPRPGGPEAPDGRVTATGPVAPPPLHAAEAARRGAMAGPQLLVFRNLPRESEGCDDTEGQRATGPADGQTARAVVNEEREGGAVDARQHTPWALHPRLKLDVPGAELCHRHAMVKERTDWPVAAAPDASTPLSPKWVTDGPVLELARTFGQLGVAGVPDFLLKEGDLPHCSCQSALGQAAAAAAAAGVRQGEDPTETSDALLVLEGLASEEVNGLGVGQKSHTGSQDGDGSGQVKGELASEVAGAFALKCLPTMLSAQAVGVSGALCSAACHDPQLCCLLRGSLVPRAQASPADRLSPDVPAPESRRDTPASSPKRSTGTLSSRGASGGGQKTLKVPGKSRKGSLKIRLSKLFRTKSCSGSNNLLDKRPSVTFSISSAGSLVDMSGVNSVEQDTTSQHGLTRAQSAFSTAAFTPVFTGETVSLVDVDISQRGRNSPHPPTPPPPPRRSLSLLDDIGGPQPGPFLVSVMGASLQSLPLPLPPPPPLHATIQHSLSLNDAFFRALPHSAPSPMETPPPSRVAPPPNLCPLRGVDSSSFTASLRELERCGWYWGPMNWEDAELKLKGKPDGSFLVRDSSDPRYILSLSFRSQGVTHHTRMEHYRGTFSLWCHPKFEDRCHSVVEFIERAIMHSKNGKFLYFLRSRVPGLPPTPVQLLYPVSRFCNVKSLQHLCRFCIRQLVRIDHIQELPLPKPLIVYLRKFYYYDPEEEMYLSIKGMRQMAGVEQEPESET
ncbi:suppressor of cytokine signaling 7 isoform X1 [Colossoma macropomum]|uniref:suppressor of cytokine signaling 7 isoform X1 n=1 Tax=Colossoma macropomum TaxID=42526 RepID=UPI0018650901|nr:suppressor of cytokine signaling 7 isoform X1 [Colossoma macropomum]